MADIIDIRDHLTPAQRQARAAALLQARSAEWFERERQALLRSIFGAQRNDDRPCDTEQEPA